MLGCNKNLFPSLWKQVSFQRSLFSFLFVSRTSLATFHEGKHNISHMSMDIARGLMVTCGTDRVVKVACSSVPESVCVWSARWLFCGQTAAGLVSLSSVGLPSLFMSSHAACSRVETLRNKLHVCECPACSGPSFRGGFWPPQSVRA